MGNMVERVGSSVILSDSLMAGNLAVMASSVVVVLVVMAVIYGDGVVIAVIFRRLVSSVKRSTITVRCFTC